MHEVLMMTSIRRALITTLGLCAALSGETTAAAPEGASRSPFGAAPIDMGADSGAPEDPICETNRGELSFSVNFEAPAVSLLSVSSKPVVIPMSELDFAFQPGQESVYLSFESADDRLAVDGYVRLEDGKEVPLEPQGNDAVAEIGASLQRFVIHLEPVRLVIPDAPVDTVPNWPATKLIFKTVESCPDPGQGSPGAASATSFEATTRAAGVHQRRP